MCTACINDTDLAGVCPSCGVREYVFEEDPVRQFVDFACDPKRKSFQRVICVAHNAKGFDAQFVLRYIVKRRRKSLKPPMLILSGTSIIMMKTGRVTFIDSLNYFHMPLSGLPKAFGLVGSASLKQKGVFPHLFNTPENQHYIGPLPPLEFYSPDTMPTAQRDQFLAWYNEQRSAGYVFNFRIEFIDYCRSDVAILR
ncbi:uncharacterized protein LOC112494799 [Cephus cinctus]|uniref:DNA-directed DNA polymerase n=1 Tax=Cephus cinctus TaxID=211228 RepID=A0AAJ7RNZ7_CEPCN|nr:uncharacterized protein LOC112494799 [Cephus cinctus]